MPRASKYKTRNRTRDMDQIYDDKKPENIGKRLHEATVLDEDKPALGQHFCLLCDKYFLDSMTLSVHQKQKPHKRRAKALQEEQHSQDVADWAANVGPVKRRRNSSPHPSVSKLEVETTVPIINEPTYVALD